MGLKLVRKLLRHEKKTVPTRIIPQLYYVSMAVDSNCAMQALLKINFTQNGALYHKFIRVLSQNEKNEGLKFDDKNWKK